MYTYRDSFLSVLICLIVFLTVYILYNKGFATISFIISLYCKTSIKNIRNSFKVDFCHSNGFIKRVIKFDENKEYKIDLEYLVSEGGVFILDKDKNIIATLCKDNTNINILANSKEKYYAKARFDKASGSINLSWA